LNIVSGYASKNFASTHFIADRDFSDIAESDNDMPLINLAELDEVQGNDVTTSVLNLMPRKTVCRDGLGCALVTENYDPSVKLPVPKRTNLKNELPFPYGNLGVKDSVFSNVDYDRVNNAVEKVMADYETKMTRTVLVVYKDHTADTPILGWSMTKSILGTLYGILEHQNKIDLYAPAPINSWQNDDRKKITLNHLMRMQSGLEWDEDYASISDVTKMLFLESDMSEVQPKKEAIAAPTEVWNYSSGTSNLLSGILRDQFNSHQEYLDFPYIELIDKIGMHSMVLEADIAGNYVGSSYAWANTRDWAKFGLLYLHKGNWNGTQIFAPDWIDYVTKPTINSDGVYGAHFWLNAGGKYPDVPRDMYSANGFQGQRVYIIPSKDLVVVRTGLGQEPLFDVNSFLSELVSAIE